MYHLNYKVCLLSTLASKHYGNILLHCNSFMLISFPEFK